MLRNAGLLPTWLWTAGSVDGGFDRDLRDRKVLIQDDAASRQHVLESVQVYCGRLVKIAQR